MKRPRMVILAGGKGTRLGKLTLDRPKPMILIRCVPFLELLIKHYRSQGFREFVISTGYLAEKIERHSFGSGVRFIKDACEGKEAALANLPLAGSWVVNGDTWITTPLPHVVNSTVLVYNDTDAGAQYISPTPTLINVSKCGYFFDIGTPAGLEYFRDHYTYSIQGELSRRRK